MNGIVSIFPDAGRKLPKRFGELAVVEQPSHSKTKIPSCASVRRAGFIFRGKVSDCRVVYRQSKHSCCRIWATYRFAGCPLPICGLYRSRQMRRRRISIEVFLAHKARDFNKRCDRIRNLRQIGIFLENCVVFVFRLLDKKNGSFATGPAERIHLEVMQPAMLQSKNMAMYYVARYFLRTTTWAIRNQLCQFSSPPNFSMGQTLSTF